MKIRLFPFDFILILLIIVFSFFLFKNSVRKSRGKVLVQANNQNFEFSLENEGIFNVQGKLGITVFEIENRKIRILESPCQNKICIASGWTDFVVCLPNKVFIQTEKNHNKNYCEDFDGISN